MTAIATGVMLVSATSLALGAPLPMVSLLLSILAIALVLLVLHGERKRNALLHTLLDRVGREAGVATSRQDC